MKTLGNVVIVGDSFSTFEGYIPEGYVTYYTNAGHEHTDVNMVEQTWWYHLLKDTDSTLILNESYSGTTVCNTGYNGKDMSKTSFIARLDKLVDSGWFNETQVDTLFIFGGTNDSGASSPLGEWKYDDWQKEDLYSFKPALCYMLNKIKTHLPKIRPIFVINYYLKPELIDAIISACEKYGVEHILLTTVEINSSHPTIKGMEGIYSQIKKYLEV